MSSDDSGPYTTKTTSIIGALAPILAAVCIGFAIHQRGGEYTNLAIILVTIALLSLITAVWTDRESLGSRSQRAVQIVLLAALALQFAALLKLWPVGVDQANQAPIQRVIYIYLTVLAALLVLLGFSDWGPVRSGWFPSLLVVHLALGMWAVRVSPVPHIDVWYFQADGPRALLNGQNPYDACEVKFPDIYESTRPGKQQVYGPGLVENDQLKFGFPYPPLSLYCSTIGVFLGNDTRYAQAVALTFFGLFVGYCRPGKIPKLAATLFLFTPTEWFVLGRAWTEPFVVMFLGMTIFCACRKLRWLLPLCFGLFLASKQYLAFAVPLSFLLVEKFDVRRIRSWIAWAGLTIGAIVVTAIVTLPLALKDWNAYWFSTVTVQKLAPFRWDALSYLVWAGLNLDSRHTEKIWFAFVVVIPALVLAIWRAARGPAGFAVAMSLVYLVFIAFNKQAFCNYYFFVIACTCCAIAARHTQNETAG